MFFLDENSDAVENCPSCGSIFIVDVGVQCPTTCPAKKLEKECEKITRKMIEHCLPHNEKLRIEFPPEKSLLEEDEEGKIKIKWGLTYDFKQLIKIPWYTLRSEKEFFNAIAHEISHITAYEKKFNLWVEREVICDFETLNLEYYNLEDNEHNEFRLQLILTELKRYYTEHEEIIDRYRRWESRGHDYNFWYREYLRIFGKLVKSHFVKYACGNTKPRSYGFNKDGSGKYDPNKR